MIHKFKDYNENEQREIVYEIIRQKYMHDPNLNNFQNNTKFITNLIKGLLTDQISADLVQTKLEELYSKVKKSVGDEILYYFYNVVEGSAERAEPVKASKFNILSKIISKIIDVNAISNTITPPEDKINDIDHNNGGFSMISYGKYPSPASYIPPPPPPPLHDFKNPYETKDFKSICDYMRYKIFDEIIGEKCETIEDLENITTAYNLMPDSDEFVNFPQVTDEDGDKEDLDFENPGDFIINDENSITFGGGGDWQEPQTFSFKLDKGKIKAFDIQDGYSDNSSGGSEEILKIICELFGLDIENYTIDGTDPNELATLYSDMVKNKDFKLNVVKEITTADCVDAIIKFYSLNSLYHSSITNPKNWKRLSKSGSGIFTRIFQNKVTNEKVKVTSTKTQIIKVEK